MEKIFRTHLPIQQIGKAQIAWEKFIPKQVMMFVSYPNNLGRERDKIYEESKILEGIEHRHFLFVQTLGVQNATVNSIRHASSTELAAQGFDRRTINVFTHHTSDSKMNNEQYIFAVNAELDSIASAIVKNHSENQTTLIISKHRGGARVSEGDRQLQFPLRDDLQASPIEAFTSPPS
ncbi:MAG: hypothetical protein EZS28_044507, partial [Streblomastix strix]